jgi:sugar lactone lactonase YvrE
MAVLAEPLIGTRSHFAEAPVWIEELNSLFWVDCTRGGLQILNRVMGDSQEILSCGDALFTGLVAGECACLLVLTSRGILIADYSGKERGTIPCEADFVLSNDAKVDRRGNLWFGTVSSPGTPASGNLYCLSRDRRLSCAASGFSIPNGPAFNVAGDRLFVADSPRRVIYDFHCDRLGRLSRQHVFYNFTEADGVPDGMTVDARDRLIVAAHGGGALLCVGPEGVLVDRVPMPTAMVTSCTFGGKDLKTLFVTAALGDWPTDRRKWDRPALPPGGNPAVFTLLMPIPGVREQPYGPA